MPKRDRDGDTPNTHKAKAGSPAAAPKKAAFPFPDKGLFAQGTVAFERPEDYSYSTGFKTELPRDEDYTVATYQYCTSTSPNVMQPKHYIRPANGDINAIKLAISYAAKNGFAVAVRSGGHMFGGFSSTNGPNVQIDMKNFDTISGFDTATESYTVGAGAKLEDVDKTMAALNYRGGAFASHGMCSWVCVGGHLQSGGFSKDMGRSFGFFIDCISEFQCILAPTTPDGEAEVVTVTKPKNPKPTGAKPPTGAEFNRNDELWFSMMGGSPGNFGVVTKLTFKPFFNDKHPEARTLIRMLPYKQEYYEQLMTQVQSWGVKEDLPADFNMSVAVYAGNPMTELPSLNNIDAQMAEKFPDIYGPKLGWLPTPGMVLTTTWTNMKGAGQWEAEALPKQYFEDMDGACDKIMDQLSTIERLLFEGMIKLMWNILPQRPLSYKEPTLLSVANTEKLVFAARNQAMPYTSCAGIGPTDMPDTYPKWAAGVIEDGIETTKGPVLGILHAFVDNGTGLVGGKFSKNNTANCDNVTALAHRDAGFMVIHYCHWENVVGFQDTNKYRDLALTNCAKWANGIVEQCKGDRRWNMFPYQAGPKDLTKPVSASNPNQVDCNLDKMKAVYFDSEEIYARVLNTKRMVDPLEVFTPNLFCVGASLQTKHQYNEADWTTWNYSDTGKK